MEYEAVIGLEVHVQLKTESKIFCGCPTEFGAPPNTHTCPVCLGMPGVLPVLNRKAVEMALKFALATGATIAKRSVFARKHYFYPDLPKNYQISQYELPIATGGAVPIKGPGGEKSVRLTRIHLEEDAGKLVHDESRPVSYVDLNRTGVPLLEIVSEPDIRSPEEAAAYLKALREIVRYLDISDGNMEEGSLRCDANISVRPKGEDSLGVKTELKNMNSFRHVQRALEYEIRRQTALLLDGGRVVQETRLWDEARGVTLPMRGKEEAHDYRYFPDPDLVPVVVDGAWLEELKAGLGELPAEKRERFVREYGLPEQDAEVLTSSRELADFFEETVRLYKGDPKKAANWIMVEVLRHLKEEGSEIGETRLEPRHLASILGLVDGGKISGNIGKELLAEAFRTGRDPEEVVKERGLLQLSDEGALEAVVREVIEACPEEVAKYRAGKVKVLGFLVGQVMRKTQGKANPKLAGEILRRLLS